MRDGETLAAFEARLQAEHAAYVATREPPAPTHVKDMDADQLRAFEVQHGLNTTWLPPRGPRVIDGRRVHTPADPLAPVRHVRDMSPSEIADFERAHGIHI